MGIIISLICFGIYFVGIGIGIAFAEEHNSDEIAMFSIFWPILWIPMIGYWLGKKIIKRL